jgi:hypothetical protein
MPTAHSRRSGVPPGIADIRGDTAQARNAFYGLYNKDPDAAIDALNDSKLGFPALYILRPEIIKLGLEPYLSSRNAAALKLTEQIASAAQGTFEAAPEDMPVLKWMFTTGCKESGLGSEYERIIDAAAILLVKAFGDRSSLGALIDLIFERHRRGSYTYDAEWALFESGDAQCIAMAADRLLSKDKRDVALARRLLKFLPCCRDESANPASQRRSVLSWLKRNKPYLYYTGESNQMCEAPCPFRVSYESKYLQKSFGGDNALSMDEWQRLEKLSEVDADTQRLLGECSQYLHSNNRRHWHDWMHSPLPVQIEASKRILGKRGRNDYY